MSIAVPVEDLPERIAEYGTLAFLVTVGDDRSAHVVSVRVETGASGLLRTAAGRRTRSNLTGSPAATLVWPPGPDGRYSLIVDAQVAGDPGAEGPVGFQPTSAVLHVLARSDA